MPDSVGVPEIISTLLDHDALTPAGKPDAMPITVAPVVVCVIFANVLLIQSVGAVDATVTVLVGNTVSLPNSVTLPQPPVNGILQLKVPEAVGVPDIVITLLDHDALTPEGKPVTVPMPVAPVVL